ncbi:hypothetical protein [Cohnella sp.]|uniref:hypothetical protein n=1 Tax=Cohnella sp. TaxID=1883426 RepID=UPI003565C37E
MSEFEARKREIILQAATYAFELPKLSSGLWFHNDIRNNFYYASYLFAAAQDKSLQLPFNREEAKQVASRVLHLVLELQDQNPLSATYGHWPLNLEPFPKEAPLNILPVELMGILMVFFNKTYAASLDEALRKTLYNSLSHIYRSQFFRKPLEHFGHHEAKYTASKLVFGQLFKDGELLEDGRQSLKQMLERVTTKGMSEYGALPWFWHWVQAFTCAWELTEDKSIRIEAAKILDYLWTVRSDYYLRGAWVGPHSRGLAHDIPRDSNVLFDYVQFGDFELPKDMPRTEYVGFLFYEAPTFARSKALNHAKPSEIKRIIPRTPGNTGELLHSYVYMTENFAVGGMWERSDEFDNEQHRWDISFPIGEGQAANQAYFFLPAVGNDTTDLRHQSGNTEVLFHQNVVLTLYPEAAIQSEALRGCLPKGKWIQEQYALFGQCGQVFMAVYLKQAYQIEEQEYLIMVTSPGGPNGVVIECISTDEAEQRGYADLQQFAQAMRQRLPRFYGGEDLSVEYTSLNGDLLELVKSTDGKVEQSINGIPVDWSEYTANAQH